MLIVCFLEQLLYRYKEMLVSILLYLEEMYISIHVM